MGGDKVGRRAARLSSLVVREDGWIVRLRKETVGLRRTGNGGDGGGWKLLAAHCNRTAGLAWQTKAEPDAGKLSLHFGDDGAALNQNHLLHQQQRRRHCTGGSIPLVWILHLIQSRFLS